MIVWLVEPILFHFLRRQSTAVSRNSSFFNWIIFFSQSFISVSGNEFFCQLEAALFYAEFFLLVETNIETWGKSICEDEIYSCY